MRDTTGRSSLVTEEIVWSPRLGAHLEASRVHRRHAPSRARRAARGQRGDDPPVGEGRRPALGGAARPADRPPRRSRPPSGRPRPPRASTSRRWRVGCGASARDAVSPRPRSSSSSTCPRRPTRAGRPVDRRRAFTCSAASPSSWGSSSRDVATLCASPFVVDTAGWPPFGQFVGARRQELRLSRAGLAEALGVSQSTVVSWELGYRAPASTQLTRLAQVLSVDTASLAAALPRRGASTQARRADPGSPARARAALGRPGSTHRHHGSHRQPLGPRTEPSGAEEPRAAR